MVWERKVEKACGGFGSYVRYLETARIQAFETVAYNITIQQGASQILAQFQILIHPLAPATSHTLSSHNPQSPNHKTKSSNLSHHLLDTNAHSQHRSPRCQRPSRIQYNINTSLGKVPYSLPSVTCCYYVQTSTHPSTHQTSLRMSSCLESSRQFLCLFPLP